MARSSAASKADDKAPHYSGRLLLRMPATLHAELAELARREGLSLNQFITGTLTETAARRRRGRPATPGERTSRTVRIALAANFAALALATSLAIALLVLALRA